MSPKRPSALMSKLRDGEVKLIDEISLEQLGDIYGEGGTTDSWSQIGVEIPGCDSGEIVREELVLDRSEFRTPIGETEGSAAREASFNLARKIVLALEEGF